ncbi:STAS domain-containing protein [Amycolatopsis sp. NPDC054798]
MNRRTLDLRRRTLSALALPDAIPPPDRREGDKTEPGDSATVIEIRAGGREPSCRRSLSAVVTVQWCGRTLVLAVDGVVDTDTAPAVGHAITTALNHRPRRLVVDLSLVRFLNAAGLEVLLAAHRRTPHGTDLRLVAATRATWRPLEITRLHEQLVIHTSRAAAISAPARRGADGRSGPAESCRSFPPIVSAPS